MSYLRHRKSQKRFFRLLEMEALEQRLLLTGITEVLHYNDFSYPQKDPGQNFILSTSGNDVSGELNVMSIQAAYSLADLDGTSGFVLEGIDESDFSGLSVSTAGDVNGDGYTDVLVGAQYADPGGDNSAGETYLVFGKGSGFAASVDLGSLDGSDGFVLEGIEASDYSGLSVSTAGDVNGDGYADILIGAPWAGPGGDNEAGETYVVFGKESGFAASVDLGSLDGSNGFVLEGIEASDYSGLSVSTAGDVNGDGYADIVIGAYATDPNGNNEAGETYVVFGKGSGFAASVDLGSLDGNDGFVLEGVDAEDFSGWSVSTAGDVNGDGYADIVIGAYATDPNGDNEAGEAYVVFGKGSGFTARVELGSLDGSDGFVLEGGDEGDEAGYSVSTAGDVNGDGYADLIVGAAGGRLGGAVYLMFGKESGFSASLDLESLNGSDGFKLTEIDAGDGVGYSVSTAGDVNGDGYADVLIGAKWADSDGNTEAGETYVVFGKAGAFSASLDLGALDGNDGFALEGVDVGDRSGTSVRMAGDVNGDGYADILIGANQADPGGDSESGETYVVFGRDYTESVTQEGTVSDETFWGTGGADVIVAGGGNDRLVGLGGADNLIGGAGDDALVVSSVDFRRIVGGSGSDTLELYGRGRTLDLTLISDTDVTGVEAIDITGSGNNRLVLNYMEVLNLSDTSNTLSIVGDTGDSVELGAGWTEITGSGSSKRFTQGAATILLADAIVTTGEPPETDAQDTTGIYRAGEWLLDLDDTGGVEVSQMYYGSSEDIPLTGDWDGDGVDSLAIYRSGQWLFDDNNDGVFAESSFWFGLPGDIPVVGDFDGDGVDDATVFRNGIWFMDLAGDGVVSEHSFWFGLPEDIPVAGDFDGNEVDEVAVYRNGQWFIDLAGDGILSEMSYWFGLPGDVPLSGDWNEDGIDNASVYRTGWWFLDYDGEGVVGEEKFQFGLSSDIPVSARWFDMSSEGSLNSSGNLNSVFSSSDENGPGASEGGQDIVFDDVLSVYGPPEVFDRVTISPRENESFFWSDSGDFVKDDLDYMDTDEGNNDLHEIVVDLSPRKS